MFTQKPIHLVSVVKFKQSEYITNEAEVKFQTCITFYLCFTNIVTQTMYDKDEFLQLLEYFQLNIIMKQQKILIAPKIYYFILSWMTIENEKI